MRRSPPITLTDDERSSLRRRITDRKTPARIRYRARVLLGAAEGRSNHEIARSLGLDPATVSFWRRQFQGHRLEGGLEDAPRSGRRNLRAPELSDRVLHATFREVPERGTRWTTRTLASHLGVNHMAVYRVWKANGVVFRPGSRGSPTPMSVPARFRVDLFGVLLQPPRRAVVFGVDRSPRAPLPVDDEAPSGDNMGICGGFLLRPGASDGAELLTILDRIEPFVRRSGDAAYERQDLLILLGDIEQRAGPTTEIHVFTEDSVEGDSEPLAAWANLRPRHVLHGFGSGGEWREALREFVLRYSVTADTPASLYGLPSFATAAARFAAESSSGASGLVWSFPQTPAEARDETAPDETGREGPGPSTPTQDQKGEAVSERPRPDGNSP